MKPRPQPDHPFFRTTGERPEELMMTLDAHGRLVSVNAAFMAATGYAAADILGNFLHTFLEVHDPGELQEILEENAGDAARIFTLILTTRGGAPLRIQCRAVHVPRYGGADETVLFCRRMGREPFAITDMDDIYARFQSVLDTMEQGVFIVNQRYELEYHNPALEREFGPPGGLKCYAYFHGESDVCSWCRSHEVFSGHSVHWEFESRRNGKIYAIFDTPVFNPRGEICKLEILHDVTQVRRSETALFLERRKLKDILDHMQHGIYIITSDYDLEYVNPALEKDFGPVKGQKCHMYFSDRSQPCEWCQCRDVMAGRTLRSEWHLPKFGRYFDVVETPILDDRKGMCKLAVLNDITAKREMVEALQQSHDRIQHLCARLLNVQEEERRRVSRELHDHLGQTLTLLKLRLRLLLPKSQAALHEELEACMGSIDEIMEEVRRISRNLSPAFLEDLGIKPAACGLIRSFIAHTGLKVAFDIQDVDPYLSDSERLVLFRILQQALTNIDRHAAARCVFVSLEENAGGILLEVRDDGVGFDPEKELSAEPETSGLGLAIMRERARLVEGELSLWSWPGEGTRITLQLPRRCGEGRTDCRTD